MAPTGNLPTAQRVMVVRKGGIGLLPILEMRNLFILHQNCGHGAH